MKTCQRCRMAARLSCDDYHANPTHRELYYCDQECLKADWVEHKRELKREEEREELKRVGDLLQEMFNILRGNLTTCRIVGIRRRGLELVEYIDRQPSGDWLYNFPDDLCPPEADKQSLLANLQCTASVAFLGDITHHLMEGGRISMELYIEAIH